MVIDRAQKGVPGHLCHVLENEVVDLRRSHRSSAARRGKTRGAAEDGERGPYKPCDRDEVAFLIVLIGSADEVLEKLV